MGKYLERDEEKMLFMNTLFWMNEIMTMAEGIKGDIEKQKKKEREIL